MLIDWCSYKAAKLAVLKWHYSKRMPKYKQCYLGVWENNNFIGVVIFGLSVTPYLHSSFDLNNTECAELTRIALKKHDAPVSRIVKISLKMIKRQSPGLRLIVSYADPNVNHLGTIYQAGNWIYCGTSSKIKQYYWRGQWRNDSSLHRHFQGDKNGLNKLKNRWLLPKHKYLMPLDKKMREQIKILKVDYPKAGEVGESRVQRHSGGATPTHPLQVN